MATDPVSRPAPSDATAGAGHRIVSLHAGYPSGERYVDAYLARPVAPGPWPGVILLSGMFGLTWTQRELTRLYARAGFVALSPDILRGQRPRGRAAGLLAKNSLDVDATVADLWAGADWMRTLPWVGPAGRIGIMGFCLGGGLALLAATDPGRIAAGVIYHQSLFPDPRDLPRIGAPLQCHYGTADVSTPREEVDAFTAALDAAGVRYEVHWYEGMGHSFAQVTPDAAIPPEQRAAADLSQDRAFAYLHRELGA